MPVILHGAAGLELAGWIPVNPVTILLALAVLRNRTPAAPFAIPPHDKQTGLAGLLGVLIRFMAHQMDIVNIFMRPCSVCNGAVGMDKLPCTRSDDTRRFRGRIISVGDEGGCHQYQKYNQCLHLLSPTSGVRVQRTLCAVPWTPLLAIYHFYLGPLVFPEADSDFDKLACRHVKF